MAVREAEESSNSSAISGGSDTGLRVAKFFFLPHAADESWEIYFCITNPLH
jgi:hypothetical protein